MRVTLAIRLASFLWKRRRARTLKLLLAVQEQQVFKDGETQYRIDRLRSQNVRA